MNIETIIRENRGTIIDVRTAAEFNSGSVAGSVNIPVQEISQRIPELKKFRAPYILCCASGIRSAQAYSILNQVGMECYNGGSWIDVNYLREKRVNSV